MFLIPLLSRLPLAFLYAFSTLARVVLFGFIGYRRKVVRDNLRHAFPEKNEAEIKAIHRAFEKAFCDQWIETIRLLSISQEELNKRVIGDWELLRRLGEEGKDVYVLLGHQFNWEWAFVTMQWNISQLSAGFYQPLANKRFDQLLLQIRSRGGGLLISVKDVRAGMEALKGKRFVMGLIADQNPSRPENALWIPFMHRETPFFRGPEAGAQKANAAVVFAEVVRHKRGQYEVLFSLDSENAAHTQPEEITRRYVSHLEACLRRQPHNYLWSHRRWKHTKRK